jgi:hypothetical protein
MTGWSGLDRLLDLDPRDAGCGQAMKVLHVYAELVAEGGDPEARYPGVAAHLAACGPCSEDLTGLLELVRAAHADPV